MANKKVRRKRRVRYDRIVGLLAVVTFGVIGIVNMVSTKVSATPNQSKDIVKTTKTVVTSVQDVAVDKVKVDYSKSDKELIVNIIFDTSYNYRTDVVNDAYAVAIDVVKEMAQTNGLIIEKCIFDIDLRVATTYDIMTKDITDFEITDLSKLNLGELDVKSFKSLDGYHAF